LARKTGNKTAKLTARQYGQSVFINCPFDTAYGALLDAIVFVVHDCGFIARCSLELRDTSEIRINRILGLIRAYRFGIHDISRTELDEVNQLPRFNMPLELGLFLGAKAFGGAPHTSKVCLVLDTEQYRYQKFCSDIAGQDPPAHGGDPARAIRVIRDWLRPHTKAQLPGPTKIVVRYAQFRAQVPALLKAAGLDSEITFADYSALVTEWLAVNSAA
jgi:hypothetical protein